MGKNKEGKLGNSRTSPVIKGLKIEGQLGVRKKILPIVCLEWQFYLGLPYSGQDLRGYILIISEEKKMMSAK